MALLATNRFAGDGATTSYEFNFVGKYIARTHVKVYQEDNATKVRTYVSITDGNFLNDTTLRSLPATPVGSTLVIYRDTPKPPLVDFVNGSRFTEYNMDLVARQGLFVAMEALDAGDSDARQQLLDAIAVVMGLVDDAQAAVSDATAAALAAATSAANAATSASQAQTAKTAAESANTAAQAAKTAAQSSASAASTSASNAASSASTAATQASNAATSATNAATSATNAGNSATAAAGSASAASTSATNAGTSATNATTSATNASNSASAAATSASTMSIQGRMCCRVVVVTASPPVLRLERCGGQTMSINGVSRVIPAAGITINLTASATPVYVYAGWNGSNIVLSGTTTAPVFDTTLGQWVHPSDTSSTPVAFARGDSLDNPERFLRNYYNGPVATGTQKLTSNYAATWDGVERQLASLPILLLPGDTIVVHGFASIVSNPSARIGDLLLRLSGSALALSRNTYASGVDVWQNYSCMSDSIQRGAGTADPAQQADFEMSYLPISTDGGAWTVQGDGLSTKLIVNITPYKWA